MSAENRQKLFNGLVKHKYMTRQGWRRLMPSPKTWSINGSFSGDVLFSSGSKTIAKLNDKKSRFAGTDRLYAGDLITVNKLVETSAEWEMELTYEDGQRLAVSGGSAKGKNGGVFLVPLPEPWKYSTPTIDAFELQTKLSSITQYPDCKK